MRKLSERPFIPKPGATESAFMSVLVTSLTKMLGEVVQRSNNSITNDGDERMLKPMKLASSTVLGLASYPAADWEGAVIYVSNETGGKTLAFADGTNWRRVQDRVIVS